MPIQISHRFKLGTNILYRPHFHWIQQHSGYPRMVLGWRLMRNGYPVAVRDTFGTSNNPDPIYNWSPMEVTPKVGGGYNSGVFEYSDPGALGGFLQISRFADIVLPECDVSDMLVLYLFRDASNDSNAFDGLGTEYADTYDTLSNKVMGYFTDAHGIVDDTGSRQELHK